MLRPQLPKRPAPAGVALNVYYAHVWGKGVIASIYPDGPNAQYGYVELVYRFDAQQRVAKK